MTIAPAFIFKKNNMKVKLTKIGTVQNPMHLDSDYGNSQPFFIGEALAEPTIGQSFKVYPNGNDKYDIVTSRVTKIVDAITFQTLNSVYKWEIITD